MKLVLDKFGREPIKWRSSQLDDPGSSQYRKLTEATREGLNRMSMQSDLRDVYHGVIVGGFERADSGGDKAVVSYIIQVSFLSRSIGRGNDRFVLFAAIGKRGPHETMGSDEKIAESHQLQPGRNRRVRRSRPIAVLFGRRYVKNRNGRRRVHPAFNDCVRKLTVSALCFAENRF